MSKRIVFSSDARQQLANGVDKLANAVVATLGPSGRNVLIQQQQGTPASTKDGVTVAKSIELEDEMENIGAQLVKQASIKTAEQAGDGTTTSTLLARELYKQGLAYTNSERNIIEVKRGIDDAVKEVVDKLTKYSVGITEEDQLKQVATVSANNDLEVGELIAAAMDKVGRDGVIAIEESKTGETYLETVEGVQFDRGYKSPYFVTDNTSMQAILKDPAILITSARLSQVKELLPLLEAVSQQNRPLLIIADDIDAEALSTLVVNKMRGILQCVAVKAPDFGDRKKDLLEDIAILTGGSVISSEKGMRLDKFDTNWLGKAKKVTVGKDITTIIDALGDQDKISDRIEVIKQQIADSTSNYITENLQNRLAKFIGGVAIVHVGGHTEVEMKEKKDRVDDALHATKAALEEGILPGGGVALLNIATDLMEILANKELTEDKRIGYQIVINAISKPFHQILHNAGLSIPVTNTIADKVSSSIDLWSGYNTRTGKYVDMFTEGIIDPTKVTRLALENAASVAGTMLTTEAVVYNVKSEDATDNGIDPSMFG